MKKENLVLYVLRITLTLLLITSVVAAALAGVNAVTKPEIDRLMEEKTQEAITAVLEGGYERQITVFTDSTGLVSRVFAGANGYAVEVCPPGFDSAITMMVGIGLDGAVTGISVISHKETKGLGEVAAAANAAGIAFRGQFTGQTGPLSVVKDGGTIDAITGATVTSRAVCTGVNAALDCVAGLS